MSGKVGVEKICQGRGSSKENLIHTYTYIHTHTHTYIHTYTYIHTHTHTHIYKRLPPPPPPPPPLIPLSHCSQLIRDMRSVSEATNWSRRSSSDAKYTALRCDITHLDPASSEYRDIRDHIINSLDKYTDYYILFILKLKVKKLKFRHRNYLIILLFLFFSLYPSPSLSSFLLLPSLTPLFPSLSPALSLPLSLYLPSIQHTEL